MTWKVRPGIAGIAILLGLLVSPAGVACTTAVISGKATADGRPILWKNRDTSQTHNELVIFEDGLHRVLAVVDANKRSSVWMGVNSAGLCIENSLSKDLDQSKGKASGLGNGQFMKHVLQNSATVEEVRRVLEETNSTGRRTRGNFGVIDSHGGAAIFEVGPDSFLMYDVNDPKVAPNGYLVRSNFAPSAHGLSSDVAPAKVGDIYSSTRYLQACRRFEERKGSPIRLDFVLRNLARDLSDEDGNPYPGSVNGAAGELPKSINTSTTISRATTVSAAVFQGVKPGEDPALTTMWTILGDPKFSIAVPGWVRMNAVADPLAGKYGGEIGEVAITLRGWAIDESTSKLNTRYLPGIWADLWPTEDQFVQLVEAQLNNWRSSGINASEMSQLHRKTAESALSSITQEMDELKGQLLALGSQKDEVQTSGLMPEQIKNQQVSQAISAGETYIGVYDDVGSGKSTETLISKLRLIDGAYVRRLTAEEIRGGELNNVDILIHPGGSGGGQGRELAENGREAVRRFVRSGGGYIGFCAGAYLATSHYSWSLDLLDAKVFDRKHWARGNGPVQIRLTESGKSVLRTKDDLKEIYYGQGPLLVPACDPHLPDYKVLASYESEIAQQGAPEGAMVGTTAIALGRFGEGRVFCFSPHPELTDGLEHFVERAVKQVRPVTPTASEFSHPLDSEPPFQHSSASELTPDISQKGFPNGHYCAPCAAANLLFQFDNRGLLKLPEAYRASPNSLGDLTERQSGLALLLGNQDHMETLARNGTNRYRLINGLDKLVREQCNAELWVQYVGIRKYDRQSLAEQVRPRILPVVGVPRVHHLRKPLDEKKGVMILFGSYRQDPDHPEKLKRLGGHYVAAVGHGVDAAGQPDSQSFMLHDSNDGHHGIKYVQAKRFDSPIELWQDGERLVRSQNLVQLVGAPIQRDGRIAILETVFSFGISPATQ
ncbi:MAG: BPL-N domain-containing protein [Aureliella sp.]